MAVIEPLDGTHPSDNFICPRCSTVLPLRAVFCSFCGERINKVKVEEGEARAENGDDNANEQELDDILRIPSVSQAHTEDLHPDQPLQSNGILVSLIRHPWSSVRSLVPRLYSNSLLRNSIFIMGTGGATSVFGYFFWILAAHIYSPYNVGLGSALISALTLASILANLGIGYTLIQILPHKETGHAWSLTINAGLATGIVASLLTGTIAVVALPLFSQQFAIVEHYLGYAIAFVAGVAILTVSSLLDDIFVAERAAHFMLLQNAAIAVLKIPLLILPVVLMIQMGAQGILLSGIIAMAVALIGALLLLIPRLGRSYRLAVRGMVGQLRSMLSSFTGNYFIRLGGLSTSYLLPVVVSIRLTPTDNAYYYTTSRLGDFILSASSAVAISLFAEGSHAANDLPHKVRSSVKIMAILLIPTMIFCFLAGHYLLLVFGPDYAQHGLPLFRIDIISSVPDAITNVYVSVLRVQGRLRFAGLLNLGMAGLTLVLSWILLPKMGIAGQGLAYLIAASVGSLAAGVDVIRIRRQQRGLNGAVS